MFIMMICLCCIWCWSWSSGSRTKRILNNSLCIPCAFERSSPGWRVVQGLFFWCFKLHWNLLGCRSKSMRWYRLKQPSELSFPQIVGFFWGGRSLVADIFHTHYDHHRKMTVDISIASFAVHLLCVSFQIRSLFPRCRHSTQSTAKIKRKSQTDRAAWW